jgi:NADPH:quinone reductase-like Zn-dependent oxidoreductase
MKAWRIDRHGGNEVLERVDVEAPKPGPMQVRVDVKAVGLNHLDLWVRKGVPGHKFPLPLIPGTDSAGVVAEFGAGAEAALAGMRIGSRVLVSPGISCGRCEACLSGFDPLCPSYGILGETTNGGCADSVVVPVANVVSIPDTMPFETAASIGIPFLTAWTMIVRKALLRPGEWVLVQAGGSGVSMAAIQICKLFGATVVTTVGDDAKVAKAKALGADHVIQYRKGPFRDELKKILKAAGKRGVEVAIDHVGADTFGESMKALAWGGRLVTCGATSGSDVTIDLKALFFKNLSLLGATMGSKADLLRIVGLVNEGKLRPIVDRTLPIDKLGEALELIEGRKLFGKVVLTQ